MWTLGCSISSSIVLVIVAEFLVGVLWITARLWDVFIEPCEQQLPKQHGWSSKKTDTYQKSFFDFSKPEAIEHTSRCLHHYTVLSMITCISPSWPGNPFCIFLCSCGGNALYVLMKCIFKKLLQCSHFKDSAGNNKKSVEDFVSHLPTKLTVII